MSCEAKARAIGHHIWTLLTLTVTVGLVASVTGATVRLAYADGETAARAAPYVEERPAEGGRLSQRVRSLVSLSDRPSMGVILDTLADSAGKLPEQNPFTQAAGERVAPNADLLYSVSRTLPKMIALLEKAYPGAIFAPMGRDAAPFGDVLDAFYTAHGQRDRVAPLRGSGYTIRNAQPDSIVAFFESAGFDYRSALPLSKGGSREPQRPFILMDRTSYHFSSQTQILLRAMYQRFAAEGGNPARLARRLNAVALGGSASDTYALSETTDFNGYFSGLEGALRLNGAQRANAWRSARPPVDVFRLVWSDDYRPSTFTDDASSEWHQGYGLMQAQPDGTVRGLPGELQTFEARLRALANKYEVYKLVSSPEFSRKVRRESRKLGYEFDFGPSDGGPALEANWLRSFRAGLDAYILTYGRGNDGIDFESWRGLAVDAAPGRKIRDQALLTVVESVLRARRGGRISVQSGDHEITDAILNLQTPRDPEILKHLVTLSRRNPLVAAAIRKGTELTGANGRFFTRIEKSVASYTDCEAALLKSAG